MYVFLGLFVAITILKLSTINKIRILFSSLWGLLA
jgi:hypothetical protein